MNTKRPPQNWAKISYSIADNAAFRRISATALLVNGFVREVMQKLPMEFAVEAQKLVAISFRGERWVMDFPLDVMLNAHKTLHA